MRGGILLLAAASIAAAAPSDAEHRIRADVETLASDAMAGRMAGSPAGIAAAEHVAAQFRAAGLEPRIQEFTFPVRGGAGAAFGRNVVARAGDGPAIVIGAHFDHVGTASDPDAGRASGDGSDTIWNGADDNASGVSVMLELARRLTPPAGASLVFVAFDAEEHGLYGSAHFASLEHDVILMVNLDMVGRNPDDPMQFHGVGTVDGGVLRDAVSRAADAHDLEADLRAIGDLYRPDTDHFAFVSRGIPALSVHAGLHADYHRPSDHADRIAYGRLTTLADVLADVIGGLDPVALRPAPARSLGLTARAGRGGAEVQRVERASAASRSGILPGDVIVGIDDQPLPSTAPVEILRDLVRRAEDVCELELIRGTDRVRVRVQWSGER